MPNNSKKLSMFKLRMQLLRIWFMKNILVWLQIFCVVCIVCIITGHIKSETPILGWIIYPIFKPLVDEIVQIIVSKEIKGLMDFFAVAISVLTSVGLFAMKARRIAQTDIKSNKLKIALIQANLYFNENGKLVKKTEKMIGQDLDGDGVISDEVVSSSKNIISNVVSAFKELHIIATADLNSEESYKNTIENAELSNAEEALNDIDDIVKDGLDNIVIDEAAKRLNKEIETETSTPKKTILSKIKNLITMFKHKTTEEEKEEKEETDIVINNIDEDAKIEDSEITIVIDEPIIEEKPKQVPISKQLQNRQPRKTSNKSIDNDIMAFLSQMHN